VLVIVVLTFFLPYPLSTSSSYSCQERTFIAIKPDGVQRGLVAAIIARFENKGFKLVGLKMLWPTKAKAESHYSDLSTKPFFAVCVRRGGWGGASPTSIKIKTLSSSSHLLPFLALPPLPPK